MSRTQAKKQVEGHALRETLVSEGILARTKSYAGLAEEAPFAYKDVDEVIRVVEAVGLARRGAGVKTGSTGGDARGQRVAVP
jgi:tRNA-splicing ligase RtcB